MAAIARRRASAEPFSPSFFVCANAGVVTMSKAEEAWSRAAMCVDRAQTARSEETRRFFTRLRDSWVRQANSYQLAESLEAEIAAPRPQKRARRDVDAEPKR